MSIFILDGNTIEELIRDQLILFSHVKLQKENEIYPIIPIFIGLRYGIESNLTLILGRSELSSSSRAQFMNSNIKNRKCKDHIFPNPTEMPLMPLQP
jgi:hypothetical protein